MIPKCYDCSNRFACGDFELFIDRGITNGCDDFEVSEEVRG